jgi:regulator of sigma E protease
MDIFIVVASLVFLITLHELGHFLFAKKFDVKVHEFGIGIPPRLFGKKIGETIYSLNLLPLGGFVRMMGEDEKIKNERSFSEKPIWQRAIILVAGVVSFWIVAALLFAVVSFQWGVLSQVAPDQEVENSYIFVSNVQEELSEGVNREDKIVKIDGEEFSGLNDFKGKVDNQTETITLQRSGQNKEIRLDSYGIEGDQLLNYLEVLELTYDKKGPVEALGFGVMRTYRVTKLQATGIGMILKGAITGSGLPEDLEFGGPVMIGTMATDALNRGLPDYLTFVAVISSILAFMNILPIPALDGGRLLFLLIEKMKGSPISEKIETRLNAVFFILLLTLMVAVTARDIFNLL